MNCPRLALAAAAALFVARSAAADVLTFNAGPAGVAVTAVSPSVFRVSVNPTGPASPIASDYLDPAAKPGDVGRLTTAADGHRRLSTDRGAIDVDPAAGTFSLLDAKGGVLTPPAPLVASTGGKAAVDVRVGWPQGRPFAVYGCGNGVDTLVQTSVPAHVANGIAVQPFFWAPTGFAEFVVGPDAQAPAQCDGRVSDNAITWAVPGRSADVYLIVAPTLADGTAGLLGLTGRPPVPPRWAFGYLQSRWGWKSRADVTDALHQFVSRKLPVDAFIFDFEWYTKQPDYDVKPAGEAGFTDFGWNPAVFPDPAAQLKEMHDAGVKFVGIRKPRLGNAGLLRFVRSKGWDFRGGTSYDARDLRYDLPGLRDWYAKQTEPLLRAGVDGWWDDEGEYTYMTYDGWDQAQRQALDAVRPQGRLWTIDRAFQPGTSRYGAAAWTGDIHARWDVLRTTPVKLLNWSLAGMPYCGCDIGGFFDQTSPELLTRWMEAGTFFPVMRSHNNVEVKPHFPWLFGPAAEAAIRKALDLRYRLVPLLYSLGHQTYATGEPLMRPLVMQYPADPKVADLSSEWLLGHDLLVAPVVQPGGFRTVYLPDDIWYDLTTGGRVAGGRSMDLSVPFDAVPVYVRGGAILPLAPAVQHTRDLPGGPLDLQVYPGRDGRFTLVEDDGNTTAYAAGNVRRTTFAWDDATRTLSWTRAGPYDGPDCFRTVRITVRGGGAKPASEQPLSATGRLVAPR